MAAHINKQSSGEPPVWIDRLCIGLVVYVVVCATWMITGFGGERVRHFVGLLADTPSSVAALIVTMAAARRMARGTTRTAWVCLSLALAHPSLEARGSDWSTKGEPAWLTPPHLDVSVAVDRWARQRAREIAGGLELGT